jgi:integrase
MASTRNRSNSINGWSVRWRDVDGSQGEKGGFASRKDALAYGKTQEVRVMEGRKTKPSHSGLTLQAFVEDHWAKSLKVTKQTKEDYQRSLNSHILPRFADWEMRNIKPIDIETWMKEMSEAGTLSPRTIEKHVNLLGAILKKAVINDYLISTPFSKISRTAAVKTRKNRIVSRGEIEAIASQMSAQYQLLPWLCYLGGLRPSEALGLTKENLLWQNNRILVDKQLSRYTSETHSKDGLKTKASNREIGFPLELQGRIQDHITNHGTGVDGLLFKNRLGGAWRYKDACAMFRNSVKKAGLPKEITLHQLRHTCVSVLINQGAHPKHIQSWVGHASIEETMNTYGHMFPDSMDNLADKIDQYMADNSTKVELRVV